MDRRKLHPVLRRFASEHRNAFIARNKCEQLKLSSQCERLDHLLQHQVHELANRKKDVLCLQRSLFCPTSQEEKVPKNHAHDPIWQTDDHDERRRLRSSCFSASKTSSNVLSNTYSQSSSSMEMLHPMNVKRPSRCALSSDFDIAKQKNRTLGCSKKRGLDSIAFKTEDLYIRRSSVPKYLPPILASRSRRRSLNVVNDEKKDPLEECFHPPDGETCSWKDLEDCRYLRGGLDRA